MSEHDDETQEQVRRLLAAAGSDPVEEHMPEDVASRLDRVLADLESEPADVGGTEAAAAAPRQGDASVTDLGSRRRRWPQVLAAAAAVSVIALGVGTMADRTGGEASSDSAVSAPGRADLDSQAGGSAAEAAPEGEALSRRSTDESDEPSAPFTDEGAVRLRAGSLALDVQRVEDLGLAAPVGSPPRQWESACVRPAATAGDEWLPVRLDGERAVLVLRAPAGGRRTAEVFACGAPAEPVNRVTVDAR